MKVKFLGHLKKGNFLRPGAIISDITGTGSFLPNPYGNVIIVNNPSLVAQNFEVTTFPSEFGRNLIVARFSLENGESLAIGTVHLESLHNAKTRQLQLQICNVKLSATDHALLLGDFNFDDKRNFNPQLNEPLENDGMRASLPGWQDTWEILRPQDEGKTFDTDKNPLILRHKFERMRYDRIMFKSGRLSPSEIDMLGTEPFDKTSDGDLVISDHFGLISDFKLQ